MDYALKSPRGTIHIEKALTNFSLQFGQGNFIAEAMAPVVSVNNESDKYFVYDQTGSQKPVNALRADTAKLNYMQPNQVTTATYTTEEYQLAQRIGDRERKNADVPLDLDFDATADVTENLLIAREQRVAAIAGDNTNYAATNFVTLAGNDQWNAAAFDSDAPDGSIKYRIDTGRLAIQQSCGKFPTDWFMTAEIAFVLSRDAYILDLIKHTDPNLLVSDMLPPVIWGLKVHIASGIYDSAKHGQARSVSNIWGKDCILAYVTPRPTTRSMTFMSTFQTQAFQTQRFREEDRKSDTISVSHNEDNKLVSARCAYLIEAALHK